MKGWTTQLPNMIAVGMAGLPISKTEASVNAAVFTTAGDGANYGIKVPARPPSSSSPAHTNTATSSPARYLLDLS